MNVRNKGAAGEREAAKWLQSKFNLEEAPKRNLEQVRSGGYDLTGFEPFAIEVKRCQQLKKRDWWLQVKYSTHVDHEPVVMYRKNNQPWRFLVSAQHIGLAKGFIQLEIREFILWAQNIISDI